MRELRGEDAEQVAALYRETFGDARPMQADDVRRWLENPEFEPGWLRVLEIDGRVVGYADIWPEGNSVDVDLAAPGHEDVFLEWAEAAARDRGLEWVQVQIPHATPIERALGARGYEPWRHGFSMEIELDARPEQVLPDGLVTRTYESADADVLRDGINDAFADNAFFHAVTPENFSAFYFNAPGFDPTLWVLAFDGGDLAGFSLPYAQRFSDTELGWIGSLGVRAPSRRRGLGQALLRESFARLYDRGLRRVGLGVDARNPAGALRLYERAGMRQVQRHDNWRRRV